MEEELLKPIDATAAIVAESRAAFICEACQQRLKSLRAEELDRLTSKGTKAVRRISTGRKAPLNCFPNGCPKKSGK
jgi:hypothetical protein